MKHRIRLKGWYVIGLCLLMPVVGLAQVQVMVSIPPQIYMVKGIGGDLVDVTSMLPPGGFPHTYEPTPQQMRQLSRADLYVRIHVEFEDAWWSKMAAVNPDMAVVDSVAGIERLPGGHAHASDADDEHHHEAEHDEAEHDEHQHDAEHDDGHDHQGGDPHVWLAPDLVKQQVEVISEALLQIDPANAERYRAGKAALLEEIDAVDQEIRAMLANLSSRTFLVFHPSWSYFARAYNLEQLAIEVEGKEPSAVEMTQIMKTANEHAITVIFVQPQTNRRSVDTIARQIGAGVAVIDPLSPEWADNLRAVAQALKTALE